LYTSDDLLDEVVLEAYQNFDRRPKELSLEEWLYRLANDAVEHYIDEVVRDT
jgi:DNA-directed RNA polymerase specialized sigma24 family protein